MDRDLPIAPKAKLLRDVLRFRLEFMLMMQHCGREVEANNMLQQLFSALDMVEGDYHE